MLNNMPIIYFVYAALLAGGGVMGSLASGKPSSLLGSAGFALVAVVAGVLTRSSPSTGLIVGLLDALAVAAFFVYRYASTGKAMPAFPSIALSLLVVIATLIALGAHRRAAGG